MGPDVGPVVIGPVVMGPDVGPVVIGPVVIGPVVGPVVMGPDVGPVVIGATVEPSTTGSDTEFNVGPLGNLLLTSATKVISSIFISMPDAVSLVPMTVATTIVAGLVVVVTLCLFIVVLSDKVISEGFTPRTVASALFIASKSDSVTPWGNVISNPM